MAAAEGGDVEMEEVPLKEPAEPEQEQPAEGTEECKDEEKQAMIAETKDKDGETKETKMSTLKKYFRSKSEPKPEGGKDVEEGLVRKSKKWVYDKKKKIADLQHQQHIGLDMEQRDTHNLNPHVRLTFNEIFAEPDQYRTVDCAWRFGFRLFNFTRVTVYRALGLFLAIPVAIIFGILFALASLLNNWIVVPIGRLLVIPIYWVAKAWHFGIKCILDPLCHSFSICCSNVVLRKIEVKRSESENC